MDVQKVERKIRNLRQEGFSDQEIKNAMIDEGFPRKLVQKVFRDLNSSQNQNSQRRKKQNREKRNQQNQQQQNNRNAQNQGRQRKNQQQQSRQNRQGNQDRSRNQNNQRSQNQQKQGQQRGGQSQRQVQKEGQQSQQNRHQQNQQAQSPQQNRPQGGRDVLKGIALNDSSYKLKQKLLALGNKYHVYDANENLVLNAKQKLLKFKDEIIFKDSDDEPVFSVSAEQITDRAGDYTLIDEETDEEVVVLEKKFSIAVHQWKIRTADSSEQVLARVHSENPVLAWLRILGGFMPIIPNFFAIIPHSYTIESADENEIGRIKGKFSIRDTYIIEIGESGQAPREALVASAIAIDALEGN